jgi:large-conductance mechanosensitive channel
MGAIKIIAAVMMASFFINIVRRLIMGEIKVAAWKNGTITDEDGQKVKRNYSRSLRLSLGFLVVAMGIFLLSE